MKQLLKYISIFIITLLTLVILQYVSISIPNKYIKENMLETVEYYDEKKNHEIFGNFNYDTKYLKDSLIIDNYVDCLTLNMLWNAGENKNNIDAQITMKYYFAFNNMGTNLKETVVNQAPANQEYSRYWHGSIIYIKPLLIFFNIKGIKIINCILVLLLTIYLIYLIYKKSKKIAIVFSLGLISIFSFMFPLCFQYYFSYLIMLISSIVTMKTINKEDKYFFYNMIATGVLICFMDFLTSETLTLTIPLILRMLFNKNKKNHKEKIVFIIKSYFAWGLAYVMTFAIKWIISCFYLGTSQLISIWNQAKIRIYDLPVNKTPFIIPKTFLKATNLIFPISLFKSAPIIMVILLLLITWIYIFCLNKKYKKIYKYLVFISLVPVLRILVLYAHTIGHYYFDYRALLPLIITSILIIYDGIKNEIKKYRKEK